MKLLPRISLLSLTPSLLVFFFMTGCSNFSGAANHRPALLKRYSLETYLPEIGDQGDVGSCVGWAATYYGLTIVKRI